MLINIGDLEISPPNKCFLLEVFTSLYFLWPSWFPLVVAPKD